MVWNRDQRQRAAREQSRRSSGPRRSTAPRESSVAENGAEGEMGGAIRHLAGDKGFGFIHAENGKRYFFHRSMLQGVSFDQLGEGQLVRLIPGKPTPKGDRAERVWLAE
jgi:cold shock CspA family protein